MTILNWLLIYLKSPLGKIWEWIKKHFYIILGTCTYFQSTWYAEKPSYGQNLVFHQPPRHPIGFPLLLTLLHQLWYTLRNWSDVHIDPFEIMSMSSVSKKILSSNDSTPRTSSEQNEINEIHKQTVEHGHVAMAKQAKACSPEEHFHLHINLFTVSNHKQGNKAPLSTTAQLILTQKEGHLCDLRNRNHKLHTLDYLAQFQ